MPDFESFDGTRLRYELDGAGRDVLLLHGFASDSYINWVRPGVVDALVRNGFRTIALDHRGHGGSEKPHAPEAYAGGAMVSDAAGLLDHLGVSRCDVVGYSMGAWVTAALAADDQRVRSAVLGGVDASMLDPPDAERRERIIEALEVDDKREATDPVGRSFRDFADLTGADRRALAAIQRATRPRPDSIERLKVPVLVICGADDPLAPSPQGLADLIPDAEAVVVGGTHLNVLNNPGFHEAVVRFLQGVPED